VTFSHKNRNIYLSNFTSAGFIASVWTRINVTFEDFYINNVTFTGEDPFLAIFASDSYYYDTPNDQTTLTVRNGVIENLYEEPAITLRNLASPYNSLFIGASGPTILKVHNLTVTNVIFSSTLC